MSVRQIRNILLALAAVSSPAAFGQSISGDAATAGATPGKPGLQIDSVTVFGGYFTGGTPFGSTLPVTGYLGREDIFGASVNILWVKPGPKGTTSLEYSPSVIGSSQMSSLDSLNHRLMFQSTRTWQKWTFTVAAGGMTTMLQQQLFQTTPTSALAGSNSTFDSLASQILFGTGALMPVVADAQLSAPPEAAGFYGNRLLSLRTEASLTWAASGRTSFSVAASGVRNQHLKNSLLAGGNSQADAYFIPTTTEADLTATLDHSLTPRTNLTLEAGATRIFSRIQEGYTTRTTVGLGRTMSRRWFVKGDVGVGFITYLHNTGTSPRRVQQVFDGNIGYKTAAHTFVAAYNRMAGDSYGLGSAAEHGATGSWSWRPPGSAWACSANAGYEQLSNTALHNVKTWRANAAITRALGNHWFVAAQYGYYNIPTHVLVQQAAAGNLTQEGAILSIIWSPSPRQ